MNSLTREILTIVIAGIIASAVVFTLLVVGFCW